MGALAGVLYEDVRPIDDAQLAALAEGNRPLGTDAAGVHREDGIFLVGLTQRLDSLGDSAAQPVRLADDSILTWDGQLHNRDDLSLRLRAALRPRATDLDIVAAALTAWGPAALRTLIGDWSLAWWQPRTATVTLARDYFGNRPLFYVSKPDGFAWSSRLEPLVRLFGDEDALSDEYMAGLLSFGIPPFTTLFRGYYEVPTGHAVVAGRGAAPVRRQYWEMTPATIRHASADDYADRFRELLTEAVAVRMRSSAPVFAELSGGYDSSSIVCIGDWLVKSGQVSAPALQPLSTVFPEAPESDETPFIRAIEAHCGLHTLELQLRVPADVTEPEWTFAPFIVGSASAEHLGAVHQHGGRVLLSGQIGDLITGKSSQHSVSIVEHLSAGRVWPFIRDVHAWSVRSRRPLVTVCRALLRQSLPPSLTEGQQMRYAMRMAALSNRTSATDVASAFMLSPSFARRTNPRPAAWSATLARWPISKRPLVRGLLRWQHSSVATTPDSSPGVSMSYPYLHRPLVEFVLGIPQSVLWSRDMMRPLVQRALTGVMPPAVLRRNSKGYATPMVSRLAAPLAADLLESGRPLCLVERGYMDDDPLRECLQRVIDGTSPSIGNVRRLVTLERWLRGRARGRGRASRAA